jgi:hypothetical protein
MLGNIIDQRRNQYAAARLNIVMEPSAHDNRITGADQHAEPDTDFTVDVRYGISLVDGVAWADEYPCPMTLYLYDLDQDPMASAMLLTDQP